ncbi:MAG: response regulator [Cyanobacteria bacterium P01_F01_bin.86]
MSIRRHPKFILIVDDNPNNLSMLSELLDEAGFQFRVAIDGESALALVERNQPELILLDVQMPGIDGFETCRRLKENSVTQSIPIIFTTAFADTESKAKGFALGAVDYIPKPFDQVEVLSRIRVHLTLKQLTESLEDQVQERTIALQQAQLQLVQQEKLSSLGEMVAGIAHEINNPIGFIANNIEPLQECVADITKILNLYQEEYPTPSPELKEVIKKVDLDFILEDMVKILGSFTLGIERIQDLSNSLRTFSRSNSKTKDLTDLHQNLDGTLVILRHRLEGRGSHRPQIEVLKSYGKLPPILCYPGQINQVFMNILANAIDALEEAIIQDKLLDPAPIIQITTQIISDHYAAIKIADNGMGIPENNQPRLFEPRFTTKPPGKGTGLGLAIAHQIIVEQHNGKLIVNSQAGQGTEFIIEIPITTAA